MWKDYQDGEIWWSWFLSSYIENSNFMNDKAMIAQHPVNFNASLKNLNILLQYFDEQHILDQYNQNQYEIVNSS